MEGSIPAWAGEPRGRQPTRAETGSIPAWAGEPLPCGPRRCRRWVDPRVGGGTCEDSITGLTPEGRSPRGRGNRPCARRPIEGLGSIPAWAGEPRRRSGRRPLGGVDPRVGGGTLSEAQLDALFVGRSPRGRGNRGRRRPGGVDEGSIPAWAGEPKALLPCPFQLGVDPRVGGGTLGEPRRVLSYPGRSPRGRGNR